MVVLAIGVAVTGGLQRGTATNGPPSENGSEPRPFVLVPLSKTPETWPIDRDPYGLYVYDMATGEVTAVTETGSYSYWLSESELLIQLDNRVTIITSRRAPITHSTSATTWIETRRPSRAQMARALRSVAPAKTSSLLT